MEHLNIAELLMMMTTRDDFHIFLASNTNPDTFPSNTSSLFSTLFSSTIELPGTWEVGAKSVTYPNDIFTTDGTEQIHVCKNEVPICERKFLDKSEEYYDLTPYTLRFGKEKSVSVTQLLTAFNATDIAVNGAVNLTFDAEKKIFVLDVYCDDMVIGIGGPMRQFMAINGEWTTTFSKGKYFGKGIIDIKKDRLLTKDLSQIWVFPLFRLSFYEFEVCPANEDMSLLEMMRKLNGHLRSRCNMGFRHYTTAQPDRNRVELDNKPSTVNSLDYNLVAINDAGQDMFNMNPLYFDRSSMLYNRQVWDAHGTFSKSKFFNKEPIIIRFYSKKISNYTPCIPASPVVYTFPKKQYQSVTELLNFLKGLETKNYDFQFSYDKNEQKFSLKVGKDTCVRMTDVICYILGLKVEEYYYNNTYKAVWAPALDRAIDNLFVYNNLTEPVYVGNMKSPLLCITPREVKRPGGSNTHMFDSPVYMPISRFQFNRIDISIRDGSGSIVPFMEGKTILTLHFRRRT